MLSGARAFHANLVLPCCKATGLECPATSGGVFLRYVDCACSSPAAAAMRVFAGGHVHASTKFLCEPLEEREIERTANKGSFLVQGNRGKSIFRM